MYELTLRCPVCEGMRFVPGTDIFDDRYGEPNRYQLARCSACGHLATSPRLHESDLPNLYGTYYPRKNIGANSVNTEAGKARRPFARWVRWWNGTDSYCGSAVVASGCSWFVRGISKTIGGF